jgi:hypothetical protein
MDILAGYEAHSSRDANWAVGVGIIKDSSLFSQAVKGGGFYVGMVVASGDGRIMFIAHYKEDIWWHLNPVFSDGRKWR